MKCRILKGILLSGLLLLFINNEVKAQSGASLSVAFATGVDTTGMPSDEILSLERNLTLTLSGSGSGSDTLIVELGPQAGTYDLLTRRFPLNATGVFDDGCSLTLSGGGMTVGLGSYTGLSTFHVRSYLASAGVGSALTSSSE